MKKNTILLISLFVMSIVFISCKAKKLEEKYSALPKTNEITVVNGETFDIELVSNPSTGYIWEVEYSGSQKVVSFIEVIHPESNSDNPMMVGAATKIIYKFKAEKIGETNIVFAKKRGETLEKQEVYKIIVVEKK